MRKIVIAILAFLPVSVQANEAIFLGPNAVVPDPAQRELIAASVEALVQDCSSAVKIDEPRLNQGQGIEATYSTRAIEFDIPPAGKVTDVTKVVVRLWDNAERNYGMDIYAFSGTDIYSLGKYSRLAYPIINMIRRPMPPNHSSRDSADTARTPE